LSEYCESLAIRIEELADESLENDLDLEDPFDLVALYRSGGQIAPGVEKKVANDEDLLILFRRPLLDLWCETGDDLNAIVRQVMIEELGQYFEFSEEDIDEMTRRHYQGML
jgi:predicted Zn-dependent protease with MMP-like domain